MSRSLLPILLAEALLIAGCASVSVHPDSAPSSPPPTQAQAQAPLPPQKPAKIVLSDFTFTGTDLRADRQGAELEDFKAKVTADMARDLSASVAKLGIPVQQSGVAVALSPQPVWLIEGRFLRVDQGSRALRAFIGFGAGRTHVETEVTVYDLSVSSQTPAFTFQTTGGSGAEPGAILSVNPIGLAAGAAGKSINGLSADTGRTSRMIAAYLSEMLAQRGYLSADKVRKAKLLADDQTPPAS